MNNYFFSVFFNASFARYNVQGREATKGNCLVVNIQASTVSQPINKSILIITCKQGSYGSWNFIILMPFSRTGKSWKKATGPGKF